MSDTSKLGRDDYRHFLTIPTRWMDNDVYGHVNNVVYYSYFDTVVNKFLIDQGQLDFINGQLVEDEPKISNIHLSDLESDPGEKINLVNSEPKITEELMKILNNWILNMENDWKKDFSNLDYEYVAHEMV